MGFVCDSLSLASQQFILRSSPGLQQFILRSSPGLQDRPIAQVFRTDLYLAQAFRQGLLAGFGDLLQGQSKLFHACPCDPRITFLYPFFGFKQINISLTYSTQKFYFRQVSGSLQKVHGTAKIVFSLRTSFTNRLFEHVACKTPSKSASETLLRRFEAPMRPKRGAQGGVHEQWFSLKTL